MKILSVCTSVPGEDAAWLRISSIARILRSKGHDVNMVHYVRKSSYEKLENRRNEKFYDYNQSSFIITSVPIVHIAHLKKLLKEDYDLVYGNLHYGAFCSILGKLTKIPLIFDMHDVVEAFLPNNEFINLRQKIGWNLKKFIEFVDLHFSNKIVCVSNKMIEYLHNEKKIPIERMVYVTNGVDLEFFKPVDDEKVENLKQQLGLEDKIVFGYIGSLDKWQGVENFIEAAKKFDNDNLAFIIVGGQKDLRKNNVFLIPRVSREKILDYYSVCDILVLPRPNHIVTEVAAPTKFAEYTAIGKPILVANVGDASNLVRKYSCGIVVDDNSPENLAKGITEFKGKSINELKKMGKNSRRLAENEFDWNKLINNLLKVIEDI